MPFPFRIYSICVLEGWDGGGRVEEGLLSGRMKNYYPLLIEFR